MTEYAMENMVLADLWQRIAPDRPAPIIVASDVERKDWTGVGYFTHFRPREHLAAPDGGSGYLPVRHVLTHLLVSENGILDHLEGFTYHGPLLPDDPALRILADDEAGSWKLPNYDH